MQTEHATTLPPLAAIQNRRASDTNDVNLFVPAGHALLEGGQQVSAQMLAFWQSRLKDAVATGQRLLECASAPEAWEVQLEYAQTALQAYVDQSTKIAGVLTHTLTDSLRPNAAGAAPGRSTAARAA